MHVYMVTVENNKHQYVAGLFTNLNELKNELFAQGIDFSAFECDYDNGQLDYAYLYHNETHIIIKRWIANALDEII